MLNNKETMDVLNESYDEGIQQNNRYSYWRLFCLPNTYVMLGIK